MKNKYVLYRWIVWLIPALIYFIAEFHRSAVGVIQSQLTDEFQLTATQLAAFGSIYFYIYMVMQIPVGILSDLFGVRKIVTIGALISGIGSLLFGMSDTLAFSYTARFLVGLGSSMCYVPLLSVQNRWFRPREFGTMTGLSALVGNLGSAMAQTPFVLLLTLITWRSTFIGLGIISLFAAIVCFTFVKNTPEEIGLPCVAETSSGGKDGNFLKAFSLFFRNPHTWVVLIICFAVYGPQLTLTSTFGQLYFISTIPNCNEIEAGNYTLMCTLGFGGGSLILTWLSDRLGRRKNLSVIMAVTNMLAWAILVFWGRRLPAALISATTFCIGVSNSIVLLCFSINKEINSPRYVGISTSVTNAFCIAGAAVVPMFVGKALDHFTGIYTGPALYNRAFFILVLFSFAAAVTSFFLKETFCKSIYKEEM